MHSDDCEPKRRSRLLDVTIVRTDCRPSLDPRDSDDLSIELEPCLARTLGDFKAGSRPENGNPLPRAAKGRPGFERSASVSMNDLWMQP